MLTDCKLFIYEEKIYWKQIKDKNGWKPISSDMFNDIYNTGWIEDLEYFNNEVSKEDLIYKELTLREEDKIGLMVLDDITINDFNEFDNEIKDKQEYPFKMIDMIDYGKGIVYIIKYNKQRC